MIMSFTIYIAISVSSNMASKRLVKKISGDFTPTNAEAVLQQW